MKKTILNLFLVLCTVLFGCGSAKTPFTYSMQYDHHYSQAKLKKVQFYTSEKITLTRTVAKGEAITNKGQLTQVDNTFKEVITIPAGTPCVLDTLFEQNKFVMNFGTFSIGDNSSIDYDRPTITNLYLVFGVPLHENYYSLMCKNWESDMGEVTIEGKTFYTSNSSCYVMLKHKSLQRISVTEKTIKGKKVN